MTRSRFTTKRRKRWSRCSRAPKFSKPIYEQAARTLVENGGGVFSHTVGMAVHDVGSYRGGPLKPGQVFSIDPQLRVREENLYLRFEDTVVVTETGVENFTDFIPMELDDMEKLVPEKGIVQHAADRRVGNPARITVADERPDRSAPLSLAALPRNYW